MVSLVLVPMASLDEDSLDRGLRLTDNSCFQGSPPPPGGFTSSMSSIDDCCHLLLQVTRKQKEDVIVFTEHTYSCALSTPDTGLHRQSGSTVNHFTHRSTDQSRTPSHRA